MPEEKIVIKFTQPHSKPGGPGWNAGEQAAFNRADADTILRLKRGVVLRTVSPAKAPDEPPKNKQVTKPGKKKSARRTLKV